MDAALLALIEREATGTKDVEVVFDAPTKDWAGRRNAPTIDVYLYDIREDLRRRERGLLNEYDAGRITARHLPPRYFKLSYLVTAWTQRPEDEHRLLSSLLACFLRHEELPADTLTGPLAELGLSVPLTIALPPPEDRSFADVWSALGGELKPSLDVVVSAPTTTGPGLPRRDAHRRAAVSVHGRCGRRLAAARDVPQLRAPPPGQRERSTGTTAQGTQEVSMTAGADEQLLARLQDVEARVRLAVEHRRTDDPAPDDPFRGLYVNDESVERLLAGLEPYARLRHRPAGRRRSGTADDLWPATRRSRPSSCGSWSRPWCPTWTAASSGSTATSTTT